MDAFSASLMKDKREIVIAPTIYKFDTFGAFAEEFKLGERDVVLTNEFIYKPFMEELGLKSKFVFQEKFGAGEPSEAMIETMYEAIPYDSYDRVIAVGGGAIMDLCKLLGCKRPTSVHELYFKREPVVHEKEVIAIPTTCGTGSEVTNISVAIVKDEKDGKLTGVEVQEIAWKPNPEGGRPIMEPAGKPEVIKAEIVLLAMGFLKPEQPKFADNVFVAGDAANGASLVVRAMASGKATAKKVDEYLRHQ